MSAPSVIVLGPDRRSDFDLAHADHMQRSERRLRLDRLEVLHTREIQEREGL